MARTVQLDVHFTSQKVRSLLGQIRRLQSSDFPYEEPRSALDVVAGIFNTHLTRLSSLDPDTSSEVRRGFCADANGQIAFYHERLGFILRSTNVRNAFELYAPLLQICRAVCGSDTKLILSSEWEFSPFTYPAVTSQLPNLMFIGLPASEAGNALIAPLAGHEIGHSVWRKNGGQNDVASPLRNALKEELTLAFKKNWSEFQRVFDTKEPETELLNNLLLRLVWSQSYKWASRQIEELYCDQLGLVIFGEGFLYSSIYLLSPSLGDRNPHYPSLSLRTSALVHGCPKLNVKAPDRFEEYFHELPITLPTRDQFVLKMADHATSNLVPQIINEARKFEGTARPSGDERDRIAKQFASLSPAAHPQSLADIINAGWVMALDWSPWEKYNFSPDLRTTILNDLVLKTVEVLEYEAAMRRSVTQEEAEQQ